MEHSEIQVFIDATLKFFSDITGEEASTGIPVVVGPKPPLLGYVGLIGIAGNRRGTLYITTSDDLVANILKLKLGVENPTHDEKQGLVGEIANTIAGNATDVFGAGFLISVPVVMQGQPRNLNLMAPTFSIPFSWRNEKAFLVVGIE